MSRQMPIFTFRWLCAVGVVAGVYACNTEMRWNDGQAPKELTTRMDQPEGVELPDIQVADAKEVDLVESVLMHRAHYRKMLEILRDYYVEHGYSTKQKWAEAELEDLRHVKPYKYIMSAEIPETRLRPTQSIAEADAMYDQGVELMRKGGHGVPALYNRQYMRQALDVFTELIRKYPNSDKIDDAAFCNGEILKEYFKNCETLAVSWYERCRQWDPNSPHPALFQAAVVYDYRLQDRAKALELYHRVLEEEQMNKSNTAFASRRIYELTEGVAQITQPRRPAESTMFGSAAPERATTLASPRPAEPSTTSYRPSSPGVTEVPPAPQSGADARDEEMVPVINLGPDTDE